MLVRAYLRWAERRDFKVEVIEWQPGDEAGIKAATLTVTGDYAYGLLLAEAPGDLLEFDDLDFFALEPFVTAVVGDTKEPAPEFSDVFQVWQRLEGGKKYVLGQVFRIKAVAAFVIADVVDRLLVASNQRFKGFQVALQSLLDERLIFTCDVLGIGPVPGTVLNAA